MTGAFRRTMDAILFGFKRAHHVSLRFGRELLTPFGLTPARFDALFALHELREEDGRSTRQCDLRRELGVARSTISRMLRSLERLGLVERGHRRYTRGVSLTRLGASLMRCAVARIHRARVAYRKVQRAIRITRSTNSFVARGVLDATLNTFRRELGDSATLYYPWDPDD